MAATLTLRTIAGQTLATHRLDTPFVIRAQNQVQYLLADDNGMAANAIAERAGNDLLVNVDGAAALRVGWVSPKDVTQQQPPTPRRVTANA